MLCGVKGEPLPLIPFIHTFSVATKSLGIDLLSYLSLINRAASGSLIIIALLTRYHKFINKLIKIGHRK